jgi:hypothetical protein
MPTVYVAVYVHELGIIPVPFPTTHESLNMRINGRRLLSILRWVPVLLVVSLEFGTSGLVCGRGKDTVGDYTIAGRFAVVRVAFTKQYDIGPLFGMFDQPDNLGHAVEYSGRRSLQRAANASTAARWLGTGIQGRWVIEEERNNNVLPDSGSWHVHSTAIALSAGLPLCTYISLEEGQTRRTLAEDFWRRWSTK